MEEKNHFEMTSEEMHTTEEEFDPDEMEKWMFPEEEEKISEEIPLAHFEEKGRVQDVQKTKEKPVIREQMKPPNASEIKLKNVEESTKFYEASSHEKLLPFLNAKASYHESQLETLSEKRNTRVMKLEKNQMKIQKLTAKAEKYEDMQRFLGTVAGKFPPAKAMMEQLQRKTQKIRSVKLPKRQEKAEKHRTRIAAIDRKSMKIGHKLDRSVALSDTIKSFDLTKNRRQAFVESLNRLNRSTRDCSQDKLDVQTRKLVQAKQAYAELGHEQKFSLLEKIQERQEKCNQLQARVDKLNTKIDFTKQRDNTIDVISAKTEKILGESSQDDKMDIPSVSEKICVTGAETVRKMEQVQTAEKVTAKPNTKEVQNPDLYNALSAKERYTQRMNENFARETAARLQRAGVEYSAVFDGKNPLSPFDKRITKRLESCFRHHLAVWQKRNLHKQSMKMNGKIRRKRRSSEKKMRWRCKFQRV